MIDPTSQIHPSSYIHDGAQIGPDCIIGPFCVLGPQTQLGRGVIVHSHVAIWGDTQIGDETQIWPHSSLGHQPQDLKYNGEPTQLLIGKRNKIRESTSINTGTLSGGGITKIGDDNLFMIGAHIGHDCLIGNRIVFANNAAIAGHVTIEDDAIIGGQVGIIQFTRIGKGAMIGAGSMIAADVLPYALTQAPRAELGNLNIIGLRRQGIDKASLRGLKETFHALFDGSAGMRKRAQDLMIQKPENPYIREMLEFILTDSERSYLSPGQKTGKKLDLNSEDP